MSERDFQEAVGGLRNLLPQYRNRRMMVTGYLVDPATNAIEPDPTSRAVTGNLYVHGYPRGANVQVLAGQSIDPYVPGVRVWVGENEANQAVAYAPVVDRNSVQQFGAGLVMLSQPKNVPTMALIEGRVQQSELGGMYVHVNSFVYADGLWLGGTPSGGNQIDPTTYDFDVTASIPATDGFSRWVRVYFDPATETLLTADGSDVYTGNNVWLLDPQSIFDIPIPSGTYSLGAVGLTYGQASLDGGYFASAREFLGRSGGADFDVIMTDGNFDVMVDGAGNVMIEG